MAVRLNPGQPIDFEYYPQKADGTLDTANVVKATCVVE